MARYRFHGNYCGPGWTAGKYMDASDATEDDWNVPPVDDLDKVCKYHDHMLWLASKEDGPVRRQMQKQADQVFVNDMGKVVKKTYSWMDRQDIMSYMVWALGPGAKLRGTVMEDGSLANFPPKQHIDLAPYREAMSGGRPQITGKSFSNLHDVRH